MGFSDGNGYESFQGEAIKITLVSSSGYGPIYPGSIKSQKLTINASGRVTYTTSEFTPDGPKKTSEGHWKRLTLLREEAESLLSEIARSFRAGTAGLFCCDAGQWELTITNSEGKRFHYAGDLVPTCFEGAEDLSYRIRSALLISDFLAFDEGHGFSPAEYIYLSVVFSEGGKAYYYQTDDETIAVGDLVVVPVRNGSQQIVTVVKVEHFNEDELPMPANQVKYIIESLPGLREVFCPLCKQEIAEDDCYEISSCADNADPSSGVPPLIDGKTIAENREQCISCRYHSPESYRPKGVDAGEDLALAHKASAHNRLTIKKSRKCGCFYCLAIFTPDEIKVWGDHEDTALCPFCDIDAVLGDATGFPITSDFLKRMHRNYFESGYGSKLSTPFGDIKLTLDGQEQSFKYAAIKPNQRLYPDLDGLYRLYYCFEPDGGSHELKLALTGCDEDGDIESGERLEAISFYSKGGKLTIGCEAEFGWDKYDFDGTYDEDGVVLFFRKTTRQQTLCFGIAWLNTCTDKNDVQTWFGADPTI